MSSDVNSDTQHFAEVLDALADLLARHGQDTWAAWLLHDAAAIRQGNLAAASHAMSAFGGMGSLNDVVLTPIGMDHEDTSVGIALNERFRALLAQAYALGRVVANDVETQR